MKILFAAGLPPEVIGVLHLKALRDLGHEVHPFNFEPYWQFGGKYGGYLFRKLRWGPSLNRLNRDLLKACQDLKPDMVWIGKGVWVRPGTLAGMKKEGAKIVHYTPDPAFHSVHHVSRHFEACAHLYDLVVTTKDYELEAYRRKGFQNVLFQHAGYDRYIHRKMEIKADEKALYENDVVFIGRWEPNREATLAKIRALGVRLAFWGPNFDKASDSALLQSSFKGPWIVGENYAKAMSGTKIALCFLSQQYPDQSTQRSFEIPACGPLMLAQRTPEHLGLFAEGKEAAYFSNEEEMLGKIRYYIDHEPERKAIAQAGWERCLKSGHSYHDRERQILDALGFK
jgi:spore maturation protein CgeB